MYNTFKDLVRNLSDELNNTLRIEKLFIKKYYGTFFALLAFSIVLVLSIGVVGRTV